MSIIIEENESIIVSYTETEEDKEYFKMGKNLLTNEEINEKGIVIIDDKNNGDLRQLVLEDLKEKCIYAGYQENEKAPIVIVEDPIELIQVRSTECNMFDLKEPEFPTNENLKSLKINM